MQSISEKGNKKKKGVPALYERLKNRKLEANTKTRKTKTRKQGRKQQKSQPPSEERVKITLTRPRRDKYTPIRSSMSQKQFLGSKSPIALANDIMFATKGVSYVPDCAIDPDIELLRYNTVLDVKKKWRHLCSEFKLRVPKESFNRWIYARLMLTRYNEDGCYFVGDTEHFCDPVLGSANVLDFMLLRTELINDFPARLYLDGIDDNYCVKKCKKFANLTEKAFSQMELGEDHSLMEHFVAYNDLVKSMIEDFDADKIELLKDMSREFKSECETFVANYIDETELFSELESFVSESITSLTQQSPSNDCVQLLHTRVDSDHEDINRHVFKFVKGSLKEDMVVIQHCEKKSAFYISRVHYDKLKRLYEMHMNQRRNEGMKLSLRIKYDQQDLLVFVFCLMCRYSCLMDNKGWDKTNWLRGSTFHSAIPQSLFSFLGTDAKCGMEMFASPFNCYFPVFCSAFPDIDQFFGSRGSGFQFVPRNGTFEANPPFAMEPMVECATRFNMWLDHAEEREDELRFIMVLPHWTEPPAPYLSIFEDSQYIKEKIIVRKGEHSYISGSQHTLTSGFQFRAAHDTVIYVLSTSHSGDLKESFESGVKRCFT
ncbi:hypothetical protein PCE1_000880 [Barthelona sp. PCE]